MAEFALTQDRLLIDPQAWLDVIGQEYLDLFIREGGAAVKVISGSPKTVELTADSLGAQADAAGYHVAYIDPGTMDQSGRKPDVHRIDKLFFGVSQSIDWKALSMAQAFNYLRSRGINVEGRTLDDLDGIAADNGRDPTDLYNQYQTELATPQIMDYGMALDFRTAVTALGRAQLAPSMITPTVEEVLLAWFVGKALPGAAAALKKLHIFERINQSNARHYLASLCRWLPNTGRAGLVVVLDFRPYENKKIAKSKQMQAEIDFLRAAMARGASMEEYNAAQAAAEAEPSVFYSDAAYMQMLTLIRHFIDEIDWFERFMLVVLTSPRFYDSQSQRNYNNYDALQTRIGLEIHDARRANPAASLVHLGFPS